MKKVIILILIFTSCMNEPRKLETSVNTNSVEKLTDSVQTENTYKGLMEIDSLEQLMSKSDIEFMSWVKRNGYNYFKNPDSEYASYTKKNETISFMTDIHYTKILSIKYETNDENTYYEMLKNFNNSGYIEKSTTVKDSIEEKVLTNDKFELELIKSKTDSLSYKITIKEKQKAT